MRRLLALALLVFSFALTAQEVPEVARSLMEEADRARDANRVDEAIEKYSRVIEVAPQIASAYVNLGALQHKQGKVEDAFNTFARGVERAPADRTLLSNAAATAQQLGKTAEALGYVDRAIERNKRDAALHSLRATILRTLNRDTDALTALQQAVQLEPRDARYQFSLGNLLYAIGRKDESITAYRKAVELDKSMLRAYYNLGAVLFDVGRDSEALGAYKVALAPVEQSFAKNEAVDPIHARAYANLGAIYLKQRQFEPAADAYGKALRLDPKNPSIPYNLGFIYFSTNRLEDAEKAYQSALALDPTLPLAYLHLGQIAYRRGDHARAVQLLTEGKSRFEGANKIDALHTLGRAELGRNNRNAASAAFEEVLRDAPNDIEALVQLGRIYRQERRNADALKLIEQAQRLAPENRAALLERALLAREAGDLTMERTLTEDILRRDPNRVELWPLRANLVFILLRQNNLADARRQLDAAIAAAPANQATTAASLRSLRALLLAREGKFDEAQRDVAGTKSNVAAIIDALAGRRDAAARTLQELGDRANLGLVLWQLGRAADAKPHLAAAANPWQDINIAAGELALADRNYERAISLLGTCVATPAAFSIANETLDVTLGKPLDCSRARAALAVALLSEATDSPRNARQLADRALALNIEGRLAAAAYFLKGSADLAAGDINDARSSLTRATTLGLPSSVETIARGYLATIRENEEAARVPDEAPDPVSSSPRRTVVVFLPDAPADDKKVAEAANDFVSQLASQSGVALQTELFRRGDDARAFIATNRERVGVVISNSEFVADVGGFQPKFQFTRDGRQSYRRIVIVPATSSIKSLADLRGRTISIVDGLRDATSGSGATVTRTPDDLTAAANALFGKTDAALVAEANPLLAQNAGRYRVIHTTGASGLPVVAMGPMLAADREALMPALRGIPAARLLAPIQVTSLASLDEPRERPQPKRIEVATITPAALGLTYSPAAPVSVAYRVSVQLPTIAIPDDLFE